MPATEASSLHEQLNTTDLRIDVVDRPDPVKVRQHLSYEITITNQGPNPASSTFVVIDLPDGITLVETSQCLIERSGETNCTIGEVAARTSFMLTLDAQTGTVGGHLSTTFTVGNLLGPDVDVTDNEVTIVTDVRAD
jgi:uncharacterized repeat protein (TIGR01451 family)